MTGEHRALLRIPPAHPPLRTPAGSKWISLDANTARPTWIGSARCHGHGKVPGTRPGFAQAAPWALKEHQAM
jgi:hypothetical protein